MKTLTNVIWQRADYDDPILNVFIDTEEDYIVSAIDSSDTGIIKEYKQFDWSISLFSPTLVFKPTGSE